MSQSVSPAELTLSQTDDVHPGATVRHFDQLSEEAQDYVATWVRDRTTPGVAPEDLRTCDVVVFTEYLRVS